MKIDTWACNICNTQKNYDGWFWGHMIDGCSVIAPWDKRLYATNSCIVFDRDKDEAVHLCTPQCATRWLLRVLPPEPTETNSQ